MCIYFETIEIKYESYTYIAEDWRPSNQNGDLLQPRLLFICLIKLKFFLYISLDDINGQL